MLIERAFCQLNSRLNVGKWTWVWMLGDFTILWVFILSHFILFFLAFYGLFLQVNWDKRRNKKLTFQKCHSTYFDQIFKESWIFSILFLVFALINLFSSSANHFLPFFSSFSYILFSLSSYYFLYSSYFTLISWLSFFLTQRFLTRGMLQIPSWISS